MANQLCKRADSKTRDIGEAGTVEFEKENVDKEKGN